jgi:hypothetical protein
MSPFTYGDAARSSVDLARSLDEVLDPAAEGSGQRAGNCVR